MIMVPILNQLYPTEYLSDGSVVLNPSKLGSNTSEVQTWSNNIGITLQGLDNRLSRLENMIEWVGKAYPEVIAGYKAVQDVEKSVA